MIIEKIKEYDKIYIIGHIRPDGDCYGSAIGLKEIINDNFNKDAKCVLERNNLADILEEGIEPGNIDYQGSLVISVDTGSANRVCDQNYTNASLVIRIDHHILVDDFGDLSLVESNKGSCSEVIADFAMDNNLVVSKKAARALYLGVTTDTGRFLYDTVNAKTLRTSANLLETGFDLASLYNELYEKRFETFSYLSFVYDNIKTNQKGVLYLYVSKENIDKFKLTSEEVAEAVSYISNVKDHPIWVLIYEDKDSLRVRIRSNKYAVNEVAGKYHGGGHKFASGATIYPGENYLDLIKDLEELIK